MKTAPIQLAPSEPANPERRGLKKGLYLIPSIFTAGNILMGFFAVMASLRAFQFVGRGGEANLQLAKPYFDIAAKAIGLAVVFDMLDGRIARMTKTTTEIGVQLDSLADVVTFGIAPTVLAFAWGYGSSFEEGSDPFNLALFISFMYLMCGVFRLARFNVQASRPRILAEGTIKVDKKSFVGLPIPAAGALIAALVHFAPVPLIHYGTARGELYSGLLLALVGLLSILMVSTLRFSSFKAVGTRSRSMRTVIVGVAIGLLIFLFSRYVLLAIVIAYILYGLLSRLAAPFKRRTDVTGTKVPAKEI
jgi:CDP-diacylglycerol--serine O-phosphatidyltransferase